MDNKAVQDYLSLDPELSCELVRQLTAPKAAELLMEVADYLHTWQDHLTGWRALSIIQDICNTRPEAISVDAAGQLVSVLENLLTSPQAPKDRVAAVLGAVFKSQPFLSGVIVDRCISRLEDAERASKAGDPSAPGVIRDLLRSRGVLADRRAYRRTPTRVLRGRSAIPDSIDVSRALATIQHDTPGDWYTDPWGWPEDKIIQLNPSLIIDRLGSVYTAPAVPIDVPKNRMATRPAVVLDRIDMVAAQSLIDEVSGKLLGHLPDWVFGWRLNRKHVRPGAYELDGDEWKLYRRAMAECMTTYKLALKLDIRDFFSSIPVPILIQRLSEVQDVSIAVQDRLSQYVFDWDRQPGRSGIPQRARFSSILAQWYLKPVDELLRRRSVWGQQPIRWMDDFLVFGNDMRELLATARLVEEQLYMLGLSLNSSKCAIESTQDLHRSRTSDVTALLTNGESMDGESGDSELESGGDLTWLDDLMDKVSALGDAAPRSIISFIAKVVSGSEHANQELDRLVVARERYVNAADKLAEIFGRTDKWRDLDAWYVGWIMSRPNASDWTGHAWSRMFGRDRIGVHTRHYFEENMQALMPYVLMPVAADFLSVWSRSNAGDILRSSMGKVKHPFVVRSLAMAGLKVGLPHAEVDAWVSGFPSLRATAQSLKAR